MRCPYCGREGWEPVVICPCELPIPDEREEE
jgi:hypothetical protein